MSQTGRYALRFLGVGNAAAVELGSASVVLERDGQPLLLVDCGQEALTAYLARYEAVPPALFITHTHLDHVAGFERLFVKAWFDEPRQMPKLFVPASVVPLLHQRVGSYPNALAEGGVNFWDAFQVIPVSDHFWLDGLRFDVFEVRHHAPRSAYGLRLPGSFVFTGDTRPIPEVLAAFDEPLIAHDCALSGNPSHSGIDDLEREYPRQLLDRLLLYHYASAADGERLRERGYAVAAPGQHYDLSPPSPLVDDVT
ncbi:MAG: MBL fold metallo-hydrolase [Lysobacteraceae bacterium]